MFHFKLKVPRAYYFSVMWESSKPKLLACLLPSCLVRDVWAVCQSGLAASSTDVPLAVSEISVALPFPDRCLIRRLFCSGLRFLVKVVRSISSIAAS